MGGLARDKSRYRKRLGQLDASSDVTFDVQGTYNSVKGTASAAQAIEGRIAQFGDSSAAAQQQEVWQSVTAGFNQILPGSGSLLDTLYNAMPHAASGPGYCVSDPPSTPGDSSWPHWISYEQVNGSYVSPPDGTFEAYAYPVLRANADLENNCFPQFAVPWNVLLAATVAAWNATHAGPARTVTRTNLDGWGSKDPLAYAMLRATQAAPVGNQFAGTIPHTVNVLVNSGARIPKALPGLLAIARSMHPTSAIAAKPPASSTSSGLLSGTTGTAVAVGGIAALGLVAYRMSRGLSALPKLSRLRSVGALLR